MIDQFIFNPGLQHLGEQIFKNLDSESLLNCIHVSRSWRKFLCDKKFLFTKVFYFACKKGLKDIIELLLNHPSLAGDPESPENVEILYYGMGLAGGNEHFEIERSIIEFVNKDNLGYPAG